MFKHLFIIINFIIILGCTSTKVGDQQGPSPLKEAEITGTIYNQFGNKILGVSEEKTTISAYSLGEMLSLLSLGAGGATKSQIDQVLGWDGAATLNSRMNLTNTLLKKKGINFANSAWISKEFTPKPEFLELIKEMPHTTIEILEFEKANEAVAAINTWASNSSNGLIKEVLQPNDVNPLTAMVLANVLYFKNNWITAFDKEKSFLGPFVNSDLSRSNITFMTRQEELSYFSGEQYSAVKLGYENGFSFVGLLPESGVDLKKIASSFDYYTLEEQFIKEKVRVDLPKITVETELMMIPLLRGLGINDLFDQVNADLSGISESGNLYVSQMLHQCVVKFDEAGTEAAAATTAVVGVRSFTPIPEIRFNRAFLFYIVEDATGIAILSGKVDYL